MGKRAKAGMDTGNLAEGYYTNQDEEQESFSGFATHRGILDQAMKELDKAGYHLIAAPGGTFAGYDAYQRCSDIDIPDLEPPEGFYWYKKAGSTQESMGSFNTHIQRICETGAANSDKATFRMWQNILVSIVDEPASPRSKVMQLSVPMIGKGIKRKVTLTGMNGAHKVVPLTSWFPKRVQELPVQELLKIFPEAEAEMFMILLGRLMVGSKGSEVLEGFTLEHAARSAGIVVGDPGIGKSTIINLIIGVLGKLGYVAQVLDGNFGRFGWGNAATADLAFIDDLSATNQKAMITNHNLKSLISNDVLRVEEKGLPGYSVKSEALILACSNSHNPADYISMDAGAISRINFLQTRTQLEMSAIYPDIPDARTRENWESIAENLGTTIETLTTYLLARSAEYFLKLIGFTTESGELTYQPKQSTAEQAVKSLRDRFRIATDLKHAEELPELLYHLMALTVAKSEKKDRPALLKAIEQEDFSAGTLYRLMKHCVECPSEPSDNKFEQVVQPKFISKYCLQTLKPKIKDLEYLSDNHNPDQHFSKLVGELVSKQAFNYPSKASYYQPRWERLRGQVGLLVDVWTRNGDDLSVSDDLQYTLLEVKKYLKRV